MTFKPKDVLLDISIHNLFLYLLLGAVLFLVVLVVILLNKSKHQKKMNEIMDQNNIALKKETKKVRQSIEYAKTIQDSFLNRESCLKEHFYKSSIFKKTLNVVSGDLFFVEEKGEEIVVITIDCSGHGVPGAFMSLIAHQSLRKIMGYEHVTSPNEILYALHLEIMQALGKSVNSDFSKEGMDVSVCMIDKKKNLLRFSGARTSIFIFRSNKIVELKGDLLSIGGMFEAYIKDKEYFSCEDFDLNTGDQLIMYTDGLIDQFGGEMGKKLNKQGLKNMLQNYKGSMEDFSSYAELFMTEWMNGKNPQLDDMLLLRLEL